MHIHFQRSLQFSQLTYIFTNFFIAESQLLSSFPFVFLIQSFGIAVGISSASLQPSLSSLLSSDSIVRIVAYLRRRGQEPSRPVFTPELITH